VSIRYIELVDYLAIAADITGLDVNVLARVAKIDLADSALQAPTAGFGETEFYPDLIEKAAVLVVRLAKTTRYPTGTSAPPGSLCACS
jgi:death-on-curing protein